MVQGALDMLGSRVRGGTLTTVSGHAAPIPGIQVHQAGHPLPDARGIAGAEAALTIARNAQEHDLVLCLLSGGASALWPAPPPEITLEDLQATTDALLRAGAPIRELNTVRKHLSRLAGGQLALAAYPARILTLAVSDVVGSPPDVIGSGPTVPDPTTYPDALAVLARYGVEPPRSVRQHLERGAAGQIPETPKPGDPIFGRASLQIVADNGTALQGAAHEAIRLGYATTVVTDRMEGEAREVGTTLAGLGCANRGPAALCFGGETTVTVRGPGRGGRNQELALSAAIALEGVPDVTLAALGTDGVDGPTDAAGAMVDGETVARGRALGLDAREHLQRNDAHSFLRATGDLVVTGPTGTNVADMVLILAGPGRPGTPLSPSGSGSIF